MSVIISGASGRLGAIAAKRVLELGLPPSELILVTRTPDLLAKFAAHGVSVRLGDFEQPASLGPAFAGGKSLLLIGTHGRMDRVAMHRGVMDAAVKAGVRHGIYLSFSDPAEGNPMFASETNRRIESALKEYDWDWTILRDAIYSELRLDIAPIYISTGKFVTNMGAGRHAFVWRADCAAAAAAVLRSSGHGGKIYDITGPELLGAQDYLDLLREFGGRPVELVELSDAEHANYVEHFQKSRNAPDWMPELHPTTGMALRAGYMRQLTSTVKDLTGRTARSLRELFEANRDRLRFAGA